MNDYTMEIWLSTDGKHTVKTASSTPEGNKKALEVAIATYDQIVAKYGTKQAQAVKEYSKEKGGGWCDIHSVQMKKYTKNGRSWYSHMVSEGEWCNGGKHGAK